MFQTMHPLGCFHCLLVLLISILRIRQVREDLRVRGPQRCSLLQIRLPRGKIFHRQGQQAEIQERPGKFVIQFCRRFEFTLCSATIFLIDKGQA